MDILTAVIYLLSGLGILLVGFKILSDNIEKLANSGLKKLFNKTQNNRFIGVGIGMVVTAIIQSSSATTVMIVGFVNAGIMSLFQATAMIMGANIGTTITAQIAALGSFDISMYIMLLCVIGIFMQMLCKKDKTRTIGMAICGLGMVFIALDLMSDSMKTFRDLPQFTSFLESSSNPILLLLFGAIFTALIQSSSAVTTIIITMVMNGITIGTPGSNCILYVILGTNIGTCITAILSSLGATTNARRASLIHLMFNFVGSILFAIILLIFPNFYSNVLSKMFSEPATQIAMFHTLFNVSCTLVFLPLIKYFVKTAEFVIREKDESDEKSFLDKRFLLTPAVALDQAYKETFRIGKLSMDTLNESVKVFLKDSEEDSSSIKDKIAEIEELNEHLLNYLVKVATAEHSKKGEKSISMLHEIIGDFNREIEIADNMLKYTKTVSDNELKFSTTGCNEISNLMSKLMKQYELIEVLFETKNKELIHEIDAIEDEIDTLRSTMINEHIERVENNLCIPASSGVFISLVSNLERAGDHLNYIAHALADK